MTRQMHEMTHRERVAARRAIETRQARREMIGAGLTYLILVTALVLVLIAGQ